ncbi:hypothetical protein L1049_013613 [Liquidambar formosana]|uniref:Aluminum-activated malate transporter n=1 Tax=Liquidambar formosana TaxID=63359 RepID=A0AAP0RL24_LIQFO
MEMGSENHEKACLFARGWWRFKASLENLIAKVVEFARKTKKLENLIAKVVEFARKTKKLGQDDPRRVIHSLKVGLALTLVSLFFYFQPLYNSFGVNAIWAVMTVVVVFEFSVGKFLSSLS